MLLKIIGDQSLAITTYSILFYLSTRVHHVSLFINFSHVRVSFSNHISVSIPIPDHFPQRHLLSPQVLPTSVSLLSLPYSPTLSPFVSPYRFGSYVYFSHPSTPTSPPPSTSTNILIIPWKPPLLRILTGSSTLLFPALALESFSLSLPPSFLAPSTFLNTVLVRIPSSLVYPSPSVTRNLPLSIYVFIPLRFLCFTPFFYFHSLYPFCLSVCLSACLPVALPLSRYLSPSLPLYLTSHVYRLSAFASPYPSPPPSRRLSPPLPLHAHFRPLLSLIPSATLPHTHPPPRRANGTAAGICMRN